MPSTGASSSSSTEAGALGPVSELAGFRIERLIGRGSRGTVYEATQVNLDRRVALKLLQPDAGVAERLGRLRWPEHRNVVSLYAVWTCLHVQYVAMQLVRGSTLAKLQTSGKLAPGRAIQVLNEVAMALDAAHSRASCMEPSPPRTYSSSRAVARSCRTSGSAP